MSYYILKRIDRELLIKLQDLVREDMATPFESMFYYHCYHLDDESMLVRKLEGFA